MYEYLLVLSKSLKSYPAPRAELCLIFGVASSVGLYDRLAKVFRYIATVLSEMSMDQVNQIIDDVVACGTKAQVTAFYDK